MTSMVPIREHFAGAERQSPGWTLTKGRKTATCEVWSHILGWELRLLIGRELMRSGVVRSTEELAETCLAWKTAMTEKGWL